MSLTERRFITHLVRSFCVASLLQPLYLLLFITIIIYIFTSSFANTLPLDPDDNYSDYKSSKAIYKADKKLFASHSNYESELQHSPSLDNLETEKASIR